MAPVTEIDEDSAYIEANDSLRVLLSHGKSQSVETNASGPVGVGAEAGAGGGMQVEDAILMRHRLWSMAVKDTRKVVLQRICSCAVRRTLPVKPPPK